MTEKESDTCLKVVGNDEYEVYLSMAHADNYHHEIPATSIAPKQWRYLNVTVNLAH
ncbi:MAG TPA: hypothetical protein VJM32_03885 [Candidatus Saccharimonadales bacterium]|nr:hypothetical protein [Candidatus Saccharimonadales bacterium]